MVVTVKKFFEKYIKPFPEKPGDVSGHSLQLATAALLIEMMRADAEVSEEERGMVMKTVMALFHLTEDESHALLRLAEERIRKATGYYEFIEYLWEIAFADTSLDKHEEHMVRKIADLIYVEHKDFIEAKLRMKKKLSR
jgi:uncharacterized tellurite resistance protein B-like protein